MHDVDPGGNSRRNVFRSAGSAGHGLSRCRRVVQRRFPTSQQVAHTSTLESVFDGTLRREMVSLTDTTGDLLASELGLELGAFVLLRLSLAKDSSLIQDRDLSLEKA
jgi:hypothetical protein